MSSNKATIIVFLLIVVVALFFLNNTSSTKKFLEEETTARGGLTEEFVEGVAGRGSSSEGRCVYEESGQNYDCFYQSLTWPGITMRVEVAVLEARNSVPKKDFFQPAGSKGYFFPYSVDYRVNANVAYYKFSSNKNEWFNCYYDGCRNKGAIAPTQGTITITRQQASSLPKDSQGYTYLFVLGWSGQEVDYDGITNDMWLYQQIRIPILTSSIGECGTDMDCGSYLRTCSVNGLCSDLECVSDNDCPEKNVCRSNKCLPVSCTNNDHCEKGYCDTSPSSFVCVECLTNSQCGSKGICQNNVCLQYDCLEDSHCPYLHVCQANTCKPIECYNDVQCNNGYCDVETNKCKDCFTDDQCGSKSVCENNVCQEVDCKINSDCPENNYCENNECVVDWALVGFEAEGVGLIKDQSQGGVNVITFPLEKLVGNESSGVVKQLFVTDEQETISGINNKGLIALVIILFVIIIILYVWRNNK